MLPIIGAGISLLGGLFKKKETPPAPPPPKPLPPPPPPPPPKKDNTLLYVGLGFGGLLMVGLLVLVATRPSKG